MEEITTEYPINCFIQNFSLTGELKPLVKEYINKYGTTISARDLIWKFELENTETLFYMYKVAKKHNIKMTVNTFIKIYNRLCDFYPDDYFCENIYEFSKRCEHISKKNS